MKEFLQENQDIMDALKKRYTRKMIKMVLDENLSLDGLDSSRFGDVRLALPGENWPRFEGNPMLSLCQINCTELPYRPDNLQDIALITVFCPYGFFAPESALNGDGWVLRAYPDLEPLVELPKPKKLPTPEETEEYVQPMGIRWEVIGDDEPNPLSAIEINLGAEAKKMLCEKYGIPAAASVLDFRKNFADMDLAEKITHIAWKMSCEMGHVECSKIGGWETAIHDVARWGLSREQITKTGWFSPDFVAQLPLPDYKRKNPTHPEYVFQIATEDKAGWSYGDCGVAVFGRGTGEHKDKWFAGWNCS